MKTEPQPQRSEFWDKPVTEQPPATDDSELLSPDEAAQLRGNKTTVVAATDDKQWTPEHVKDIFRPLRKHGDGYKAVADAHNAALKAERDKWDLLCDRIQRQLVSVCQRCGKWHVLPRWPTNDELAAKLKSDAKTGRA